ncbi:hypothetical protein Nmel_010660 [Mimus melanotis]
MARAHSLFVSASAPWEHEGEARSGQLERGVGPRLGRAGPGRAGLGGGSARRGSERGGYAIAVPFVSSCDCGAAAACGARREAQSAGGAARASYRAAVRGCGSLGRVCPVPPFRIRGAE